MPKRKTTHKKNGSRKLTGSNWALSRPQPRYKTMSSGGMVRYFKRPLPDVILYTTSGPGVVAGDASGTASTWAVPGTVQNDNNGAGSGMQFGLGFTIGLDQLTQFSDILNLFRQTCILGCTMRIEPTCGDSAITSVTAGVINPGQGLVPSIVSYENLSSGGTAGNYFQALAYGNSKQQTVTNARPFVRKFKLRMASYVFTSGITGLGYAASNSPYQWQDSQASPNVVYYGPGIWIRNFPSFVTGNNLRIMCDIWIACREPF